MGSPASERLTSFKKTKKIQMQSYVQESERFTVFKKEEAECPFPQLLLIFFFKQSSFQMLTTIPSKREAHQLVWFLLNVSFDRGPFFQYSPSVQIRNALLFVL